MDDFYFSAYSDAEIEALLESVDYATLTEKTTPNANDMLLLQDNQASGAPKKVKFSNVGGGINWASLAEKAAPADTDMMVIQDNAASGATKKVKVTNVTKRLSADLTLYVATTGNDTTGDGSSGSPYRTIAKALSVVPKNLNGYTALINVSAGTYSESVTITGFYGGGQLILLGDTAISTSRTITTLNVSTCSSKITVSGFNVSSAVNPASIVLQSCGEVVLSYMRCVASTTYKGIQVSSVAQANIQFIEVSNHNTAAYVVAMSNAIIANWNAGTGNTFGIVSDYSIVYKGSGVPSGTTAEAKYNGGQIFS